MSLLELATDPMVHEAGKQFLDHVACAGGDVVGRKGAEVLTTKMVRFVVAKLGWAAPETQAAAIERLDKLYTSLYARLVELEKAGKVTADSVASAFDDPQGAATMNAACETAIETDDVQTIDALARLLAARATASPSSRLALRTREAAEAMRNLELRQLVVLAQTVLSNSVPAPARIVPGNLETPLTERLAAFEAWVVDALARVDDVIPRFDDVLQLQASRLLLVSPRAELYDGQYPPHASRVASKLTMLGADQNEMTTAMRQLGDLELGRVAGERARERAALGAYVLTNAGYLLGYVMLRARGMTALGVNFDSWSSADAEQPIT